MRITEQDFKKLTLPMTMPRAPRKKPTYKTPESSVKAACMAWLARQQVFAYRNNTGAYKAEGRYIRYGHPGSADIIGLTKRTGRFLAIETKSSTGTQNDDQIAFMRNVRASGGLYIIARSLEDLEEKKGEILG